MSVNSLNDIWQSVLGVLGENLTSTAISTWFDDCVPIELDGSSLVLQTSTEFKRDILVNRFSEAIKKAMSDIFSTEFNVKILTKDEARDYEEHKNVDDPLPEMGGYTFDRFIVGNSNKFAHSAAVSVAQKPGKAYNPLFIYGNSGLGKTHIVQSIGHEVRQRHPELQVLYVSMNKFQAQFQTAYKNGEIPDFIHFYQMIDVLIIDDIQELTGKTGTQNAFFNIFNHLQLAGKQLILTSDKPPVELKDIEQRLLTRFKWGLSTQLNTPDYDTKVKIIRIKAQKLGLQLTDEIVRYLADNISANVREIEGALSALVANTVYMGKKVSLSLVKEILKVYVRVCQKEITIEHIIEVVCDFLHIDIQRLNSPERTREVAQARQIAMYLAKQHTKSPLIAIGSAIGGRNHATVLHSCKAVSNQIETDKAFQRQMEELEKLVLA